MGYNDELLDVFAYLRSLSEKNTEEITLALGDLKALEEKEKSLDATLEEIEKGLKELGIAPSKFTIPAAETTVRVSSDIRITLPEGFDFSASFKKLVEEAHKAGFKNVRPETMLTDEELAFACRATKKLDDEFALKTGMTEEDMYFAIAAAGAQVLFRLVAKAIAGGQLVAALPSTGKGVQKGKNTELAIRPGKTVNRYVEDGGVSCKSYILHSHTPFDVAENGRVQRGEILGYHKIMGWIFGVANILTDTVTMSNLKSYAVRHSGDVRRKNVLGEQVSTLADVIVPMVRLDLSKKDNKYAVVAAVFREAEEQGILKVTPHMTDRLLDMSLTVGEKSERFAETSKGLVEIIGDIAIDAAAELAAISLVNIIISAIHTAMYTPKDGEVEHVAIRTNRILVISNVIASIICSFVDKNDIGTHVSGAVASIGTILMSEKFYVEMKAKFLTEHYTPELEKYLAELSSFFETA
ncbi:MAG: hypothetical protein IKU07_06960 [Oscillospiraceae bacterium]|nr:hypothetical protein [Oscillospiraceae bacterium]